MVTVKKVSFLMLARTRLSIKATVVHCTLRNSGKYVIDVVCCVGRVEIDINQNIKRSVYCQIANTDSIV